MFNVIFTSLKNHPYIMDICRSTYHEKVYEGFVENSEMNIFCACVRDRTVSDRPVCRTENI